MKINNVTRTAETNTTLAPYNRIARVRTHFNINSLVRRYLRINLQPQPPIRRVRAVPVPNPHPWPQLVLNPQNNLPAPPLVGVQLLNLDDRMKG